MNSPPPAAEGRKRQSANGAPVYSPSETLTQMQQEAEARLQEKNSVQKEIRAIRAQEIEKKRKEDEERERGGGSSESRFDRSTAVLSASPSTSSLSSSTLPPKPRTTYPTRNEDTTPASLIPDPESAKELKKKLAEMEEKYKKHAIYQTQFENDNQKLLYEVDFLKDLIEENDELIVELRRQFKDKSRELDFQKRSFKDLQTDFSRLKEILKQRDALIEDSGLVLYTDNEHKAAPSVSDRAAKLSNGSNGVVSDAGGEIKSVLPAALVAPETAKLLNLLGEGTIDDKLRRLLSEKQELKEHNMRLRSEVEDEKVRCAALERKLIANTTKKHEDQETSQELHEIQRQYTKEVNDLKMKLQKIEHENIVIKQDVTLLMEH